MSVTIHIEANSAAEARMEMQDLLGEAFRARVGGVVGGTSLQAYTDQRAATVAHFGQLDESPVAGPDEQADSPADAAEVNGRVYGEAEAGKARRNKEQMAEDTEIEKLAKDLGVTEGLYSSPASEVLKELRDMKASSSEEKPGISTGGERVDPAQDEPEVTREDMKAAMAKYVEAKGMEDAMEKLPDIMGYKKQSEVPEDAAIFAKIIEKIESAL